MIAVDLPGFGETPPLTGEVSIATLTDSVADFIREQGLDGVATVGQSMGGRMVLELARRGVGGDTVALDPGGFWSDRELFVFGATLRPSITLVRALGGMLPSLLGSPAGRTLLLAQLSARPWALSRETVLPDVRGLADAPATGAARVLYGRISSIPRHGRPDQRAHALSNCGAPRQGARRCPAGSRSVGGVVTW